MSNIATNQARLIKSFVSGNKAGIDGVLWNASAPGPLMGESGYYGDACAINPAGKIGIISYTGQAPNRAYVNFDNSTWTDLGPCNQLPCIGWDGTKFICARIQGGSLILQNLDGSVISITSVSTSQGILYFNELTKSFVLTDNAKRTVGKYILFRAVERVLNGKKIYCGQYVSPDGDVDFITNEDNSIAFIADAQRTYPQFVVHGTTLVVNNGKEFKPPYPIYNPEPPEPEPGPEPMPIPNGLPIVQANRVKYGGMPAGNERAYTITNASAWEMRADGAGMFFKDSGTQYNQRNINCILFKHRPGVDPSGKGEMYDVLRDAEGVAEARWRRTEPSGYGDVSKWRAPVEPVNPNPPDPTPDNPDRDMLIHIRDEINEFLGETD